MKKYFMLAVAAIAAMTMTVSCDSEYAPDTFLDQVQVSSSTVAITPAGGSATITVNAESSWELAELPTWLSANPTSGSAGESTITFTATSTAKTREASFKLVCDGATQIINALQMCEKVELEVISCAAVAKVSEGTTVRTKGVVTAIANTTYGNFYLNDGTGEVYVYGCLYDGKTQNNPITNNKIEVGDEVTVEGPMKIYSGTVELIDVTVVNVEKSLIKVDSTYVAGKKSAELPKEGGEISVYLTNKGTKLMASVPADAQEWLSIAAIDGNVVTFRAAANAGAARGTTLTFSTTDGKKQYNISTDIVQLGAVEDLTCAQFNAKDDDANIQYKVHGVITKIANTKYGNLYINDGTGEVYVYGITGWNAADYKVGDEVVLQSIKTSYKGAAQMKNAVTVEKVAHETKTAAELKELADDKTTYYYVTGKVVKLEGSAYKFDLTTYGNFGIQDATGEIYVYGVANALDGETKKFSTTGVKEGDTITILAYKTSYKSAPQIVGKFIKNEPAAEEN